MRRIGTAAGVVLLTLTDQLLKLWARRVLADGRVFTWDHVFALRFVRNTGAAFSMFCAHTTLLSVLTGLFLLAGFAALFSGKVRSGILCAAFTLILSGGLGNWIDRVRVGYVTDFIEPLFMQFAVFNFADILITVGAGLLIVWLIYDGVHGRREKKAQP